MNGEVFLSTLMFFMIRLGIPVLITIGLGLLLGKMDAHWRAEAILRQEHPVWAPVTPCWEVKHCDPSARAACPAYQMRGKLPCWVAHYAKSGQVSGRCLRCKVYRAS